MSSSSSFTASHHPKRSPKMQHAMDWITAHDGWDLDAINSLTTTANDFQYYYLPSSYGFAPKGMKEWHRYNTQIKSVIPDFSVEVLNLYESTNESDAIIAHVIGRATSRTGAPFSQEYIFIIHIREEYPNSLPSTSPHSVGLDASSSFNTSAARPVLKVYRAYEFVDTQYSATFFQEEKVRSRSQRQPQSQSNAAGTIQQARQPVESMRAPQPNAGAGAEMRHAKL